MLEKRWRIDRAVIRRELGNLIMSRFVELPDKAIYAEVFQRYVERTALSFADCFHIVLARKLAGGRLATFDRAAGRSEGVEWIEPA